MSEVYHFRPPRVLRPTLIGFLVAGLIMNVLYAAISAVIGVMYPDFYNYDAAYAPGEELVGYAAILLGVGMILVGITTVVLFCCWIFRASKNARALGAEGMRISPGWSVGWWFIPLANLFKPYEATKEIYEASDPDLGPDDWRGSCKTTLIAWWWAVWIISGIADQIDVQMGGSSNHQIAHASSWTGIVSGLVAAVAGILVIRVIQQIDARQLVKATESPAATQRYCLACDYDLSGSHGQSACPECGEPMPRAVSG
ncbi:MAG: DUF4328 domain-containing protein [Planctomycetota bacterium]